MYDLTKLIVVESIRINQRFVDLSDAANHRTVSCF